MGVGQKKKLAKRYTEQMDAARTEEIEHTTLGTKDIESKLVLDCELTDDSVRLKVGTKVRLLDLKGVRVEVFIGGRQIGVVSAVGSATLRERYGITARKGRSVGAVVDHVAEFTDSFAVLVD